MAARLGNYVYQQVCLQHVLIATWLLCALCLTPCCVCSWTLFPLAVPILTVVVPVLTTDNLTWQCSSEAPARQCLCSRGLVPILAEGSAR